MQPPYAHISIIFSPTLPKLEQTFIDSPQSPRRHVNTAVVSVQDHFTPSESEILDVAESQAEDYSEEESPNPIHHNFEVSHGYEDFPSDIQATTTTAH